MSQESKPRRLPAFALKGKVWTVDERLREFRFLVFGRIPEFVPFESEKRQVLLRVFLAGQRDN